MEGLTSSQERVLAQVRHPMRASEVAQRLGIDASGARRHLDNLVSQGLVVATDVRDGRGRPKRFYHAAPGARGLEARNHPLLLALLMREASRGAGRRKLLKHLEGIASDLAGPVARRSDARRRLDLLLAQHDVCCRAGARREMACDGAMPPLPGPPSGLTAVARGPPGAGHRPRG